MASLALAAYSVSPANAATVRVVVEPPSNGPWAGIEYRAGPAEANRVELFTVSDTTVRVVDTGASITPGVGCEAPDRHTAVCTTLGFDSEGLIGANVSTGDMDDTVDSNTVGLSANGGPGDDRLESEGPVAGTLNGGGGHDVLLGGINTDTLIDGDRSGAADRDVLDGRQGGATISYRNRTGPVVVNLSAPDAAGEQGEGDVLRAIDHVTGGAGDDVLRGNGGFNHLRGGPGDDHLYGRGNFDAMWGGPGSDRLSGGSGEDNLHGGAGDDRLLGSGGSDGLHGGPGFDLLRAGPGSDNLDGGSAHCGRGHDTVGPSAERDYLRRDCELARFDLPTRTYEVKMLVFTPYPIERRHTSMVFEASCPFGDIDGSIEILPMTGMITLRFAGQVLARAQITTHPPGRCARTFTEEAVRRILIPVTLNRTGRRLLSDGKPTDVTVVFRGRNVPRHPFTITLG